jgi:hypothetical protein
MANLTDINSDTATQEQQGGENPVAPVFNRAATEKDPMTTEAAAAIDLSQEAPPLLMTSRIVVADQSLSDDAFAAVRRGDAYRLKALLDDGVDVNVKDEQGFTLLMRATQEGATDAVKELLLHNADPEMKSDAGLTALMLAATNGNVEIAKLLMDEIEDTDMDTADDVVAEEMALEHGNMSVFFAIQARKRRAEFNKIAHDENSKMRHILPDRKPCEPHEGFITRILAYAEEKEHKIADSLRTAFHKVSHAGVVVSEAVMDGCHAVFEFCSSFFRHKAETATPEQTAEIADAAQAVQKTVAMIAKALPPPDPGNKV